MQNFSLGSLVDWRQVAVGEILEFPVPEGGFRNIAFDVVADSHVTIRCVEGDNAWLVGVGVGEISTRFSVDRSVGVVFLGDPDADVFIRSHTDAPVVPESRDPSFTTIEPRPAGPSEEIKKFMHIMRINQQRNEAALAAERQRVRDELAALQAAREAAAAVPPAPAPGSPDLLDGGDNGSA